EGVPAQEVRVTYAADTGYMGQAYELEVPIAAPVTADAVPGIVAAFHAVHERVYGYARTQQPVEFVNFRAVHTFPLPRPVVAPAARAHGTLDEARIGDRRADFGAVVPTAVYDRARLPLGARPPGPATVGRTDTTTLTPRDVTALVPEAGAFLLNDPCDGRPHLPDITLPVPVFADGRAVALACTMCHHQDVGGRTPGSVPTDATELYQEGVIIPPTQLFRAGELDENLFRL